MKKINILLTCILLFSATSVMAKCSVVKTLNAKNDADAIAAGLTAKSWTPSGKKVAGYSTNLGLPAVIYINPNNDIQPLGTILAKVNLDFLTQSRAVPYTANQVLYKCTLSDLNSGFSQVFAMKTYGSIFKLIDEANTGGQPDVYTTAIPNVGARITTSNDIMYTSTWQSLPLKDDSVYTFGNNVYVTASAFYGATLELIKTQSAGTVSSSEVQHYPTYTDVTRGGPLANIAFHGGNITSPTIGGSAAIASQSSGYDSTWPGGWSLYGNSALYAAAGLCTISNTGTSSTIAIPSISVVDLISGKKSEKKFSLDISCVSHVESSTTKPSTPTVPIIAAGFLVNQPKAVTAAKQLGLTTPAGALTWLLDSNYGAENVASGVGIRIYNQNNPINLLSTHTTGTGNDGGWYSFSELGATQNEGDLKTSYYFDFTAALEQIPNQTVTIGSVNAQLQLLINVQ